MPSLLQDTPVDQIDWDGLTLEQLVDLRENDERVTVSEKAAKLHEDRTAPPPVLDLSEYDPRKDPGPPRFEDLVAAAEDDTPVDGQIEVPLEESVKDHTTILASDIFDGEGNITNRDVPQVPDYARE